MVLMEHIYLGLTDHLSFAVKRHREILFSYLTCEAMSGVPASCKATAMGFYQAVYAVGMTVFPAITGALASKMGMRTGYMMLAAFSLLGWGVSFQHYKSWKKTGT